LEVRPDDIEHGLVNLVERGLSSRTIAFYRSTIRQIMERATDRVISFNPERKVRVTQRIGKKTEPRRALTEEEQRWIWETPHRGQPVAIIMMLSGLRRGELTALTWDDIDTKKRQITVNKAVAYLSDGTPVMKDAKSTAGMRVIDIPGKLCEYLDQIPRDDHLVVHTKAGGLMTESAWVKLWAGYMRLLNAKYGAGILAHEDEPAGSKDLQNDDTAHHHALAPPHFLYPHVPGRCRCYHSIQTNGTRRCGHHLANLYPPG
jgi:integrase